MTRTEAGADGARGAAAFTGSVTDYYDSDANPLSRLEIGGRCGARPRRRGVHRPYRLRGAR
ncbi:MAG: hypothetical protein ACLUQ6_11685 [Alistipes onderdonkii]